MWIPGCLVYAGEGWSRGVLHTLEGSRNAVFCDPPSDNQSTSKTEELDHMIASVFGLWELVIPESRRLVPSAQLLLPGAGFSRVGKKSRKSGKTGS